MSARLLSGTLVHSSASSTISSGATRRPVEAARFQCVRHEGSVSNKLRAPLNRLLKIKVFIEIAPVGGAVDVRAATLRDSGRAKMVSRPGYRAVSGTGAAKTRLLEDTSS